MFLGGNEVFTNERHITKSIYQTLEKLHRKNANL